MCCVYAVCGSFVRVGSQNVIGREGGVSAWKEVRGYSEGSTFNWRCCYICLELVIFIFLWKNYGMGWGVW